MNIDEKTITDFQAAYKADFGEEIDAEKASEIAERLLTLMSIVYRPMEPP